MTHSLIVIDNDKCIGCALCVKACQNKAIEIVAGKAKLIKEDYCDGLGNCLPVCPANAIRFETVPEKGLKLQTSLCEINQGATLNQWPLQIKLVNVNAPFFTNADLLVSADCCAYVFRDFHETFMKNKITIIGCPKLDETDYSNKISKIVETNKVQTLTICRMEVPCCSGLENAVKTALRGLKKNIPLKVVTISINGNVLDGTIP